MWDDPKPLQKTEDGGWRWGDKGKTYYGPSAKDQAIKQGIAILRTYKEIDEDGYVIFPYQ
jgi:hypothetical protein